MTTLGMRIAPGQRIALSPWSREAANPAALAELEARCEALDVIVSTVRRSRDRSWMVRVNGGGRGISLVGSGPVTAVVAGALDDFEALP